MTPPDTGSDRVHQEVQALLPWYINGTLSEAELAQVGQHLSQCTACQEETHYWRDIAAAAQLQTPAPVALPAEQFAAVMARIDATEAASATTGRWWDTVRQRLSRSVAHLVTLPRFARLALAVESVAIVVLLGAVLWQSQPGPGALYHTLSQPESRPQQASVTIHLVFAEDMRESELRALLGGVGGTIVSGPSSVGVYAIAVPLASATPEAIADLLRVLRAHPQVRLAEPATS
jgi:anti-sigma factor RsiW